MARDAASHITITRNQFHFDPYKSAQTKTQYEVTSLSHNTIKITKEKLGSKLEKLKRDNKAFGEESHAWELEREELRRRIRDMQRESLQYKSEFEKEKFRADLEEQNISALKTRLEESETKAKKRREELDEQEVERDRQRKRWEEDLKRTQSARGDLLQQKLKNKQEFLERVLKMMKVKWTK